MLQELSTALGSISIGYLSEKIKSIGRVEQVCRRDVVFDVAGWRGLPAQGGR